MMDVLRNSGSLVGPRRLSYTCGRTRCCNPPLTPSSSTIRAIFKYPRLFSSRGTYRIAHWGVGSEVYRLLRRRKMYTDTALRRLMYDSLKGEI